MWRVDTYRALRTMPQVTEKSEVLKEDYVNTILGFLKAIDPAAVERAWREACQQAVEASVNLAHEMLLSTAKYRWLYMGVPGLGCTPLYGRELQDFKLVDIKTGRMLKGSATKDHTDETIICEKLSTVFPGLVRDTAREGRELVIVKETILVQIYDEFRQKKQKRTKAVVSLL